MPLHNHSAAVIIVCVLGCAGSSNSSSATTSVDLAGLGDACATADDCTSGFVGPVCGTPAECSCATKGFAKTAQPEYTKRYDAALDGCFAKGGPKCECKFAGTISCQGGHCIATPRP